MAGLAIRRAAATLAADHEARPGASGVPLVFLHAGVADRRMWRAQLAAFAPAHPVLAYDRRGFGETRVAQPQVHAQVDDLWAAMDAAGLPSAVLVGCSQGGRIAIDAALAQPRRVLGLVLVAPAVSGAPEPGAFPPAVKQLVDAYDAAEAANDLDRLNEVEARVWLDGLFGEAGRVQGPVRELFLAMNGTALRAGEVGRAIDPPSAWDRVDRLRKPTLVAWGTLDFPHLQDRCAALAAAIPGAQSLVMEGAGHLPNLDQPATFDTALAAFVGGRG